MDVMEQMITQNPGFLQRWNWIEPWPWRKRLEGNPRDIGLVNQIEALLAEQRTQLTEMDAAGTDLH